MEYRQLGKAGIKLSELSLGSWLTFGDNLDSAKAQALMRLAFENGINFFDNAEAYAKGRSETLMGLALRNFRREDLVISTKIFWGGDGPNDAGLSWKHLVEGTKNSLKRLQLDYVDLLFCHRPDPNTPVEETVRAIDTLVRQGLVFYWGTSEWPAERIEEAFCAAEKLHCIPPAMEQPHYNMLVRTRMEQEYLALFEKRKIGSTIWSPLASGILTGKYNSGIPAGSRLEKVEWLREELTESKIALVKQLADLAAELDCSMSQLAIAWCLKNPHVTSVILGATSEQQLLENLGASAVKKKLTAEHMQRIGALLRSHPG